MIYIEDKLWLFELNLIQVEIFFFKPAATNLLMPLTQSWRPFEPTYQLLMVSIYSKKALVNGW